MPGEKREDWGRRLRARMRVPNDLDPLAGAVVIAQETVRQDADARGRSYTKPRTVTFDVLADKRTFTPLAYRFADGSIQPIGGGSNTPSATVIAYEHIEPKPPDPNAKRGWRVVAREHIEPRSETGIDADGTERVVAERVHGGY